MIQFIETYYPNGVMTSRLACDDLPIAYDGKRYAYNISVSYDGQCKCKSRAEGKASTRYYVFSNYNDAMAHATEWAKRKIKSN